VDKAKHRCLVFSERLVECACATKWRIVTNDLLLVQPSAAVAPRPLFGVRKRTFSIAVPLADWLPAGHEYLGHRARCQKGIEPMPFGAPEFRAQTNVKRFIPMTAAGEYEKTRQTL
jgi:hypothetical protein